MPFLPTEHHDAAVEQSRSPRVPRHRRWWLLALAVVLAAVGGLGSYLLVSAADERVEVLVASRDIAWGSVITDADLSRALVSASGDGHVIPASERDAVVGKTAAEPVPAGGLFAPGHVSDRSVPGPGELLVGLRVEPGSIPVRGVRPGEVVRVVPVADTQADGGGSADSAGGFDARVLEMGQPDAQGVVTVDVVVSDALAEQATAAAAGRVLLVLRGPDR